MSKNPFIVFGLTEDSTQSDLNEVYNLKRDYYFNHQFDEGEDGAEACKMLEVIEIAYQDCMEIINQRATISGEGDSSFQSVIDAIKNKDSANAQSLLDNIQNRGGEWHYYQSIIYYEKNWLAESKKQLEIALQIDPGNARFTRALENLKKKIDGTGPFNANNKNQNQNQNAQNAQTQRSYQQPQPGAASDGCCAACQALWCADCCCECMGGDLIGCC